MCDTHIHATLTAKLYLKSRQPKHTHAGPATLRVRYWLGWEAGPTLFCRLPRHWHHGWTLNSSLMKAIQCQHAYCKHNKSYKNHPKYRYTKANYNHETTPSYQAARRRVIVIICNRYTVWNCNYGGINHTPWVPIVGYGSCLYSH